MISGGLTPLKQNNVTPILGGNNYSTTPNKGLTNKKSTKLTQPFDVNENHCTFFVGRNLLRGDSPLSSGDSPKQTPQSSPPPPTGGVATGIHQVKLQ